MREIPQRFSMVAQTADILRREIQRGEWKEVLPGEVPLCARLQVSRITMRAALDVLHREGLIEVTKGQRRQIVPDRVAAVKPISSRVVGILSVASFYSMTPSMLVRIAELRGHLQAAGYEVEVHADSRLRRTDPSAVLRSIIQRTKVGCWILYLPTIELERHFEQQRLPAMVIGSPHEGIRLPSIATDNRAICRHAAGVLFQKGHRRIALLIPRGTEVSTLECQRGFLQAIQTLLQEGSQNKVVVHDGTPRGVALVVRRLFMSRAPPTALLVSHSHAVLSVITQLAQMKLRVPQDVSLISVGGEGFLSTVIPPLACYRINLKRYSDKLSRMALTLARTGALPLRSVLLLPEFCEGESVASI
ncbi:MAG: substrate-binding domain-containing protein [Verrucomicrobia bacterium]|nr:substrate-binding domain-containing protein [Verrucomicrobiota bacterium]